MISQLKYFLSTNMPGTWLAAKDALGRLYSVEADNLVYRRLGGKVAAGPFAGMRYLSRASSSVLGAKLLGSYEKELHPAIEILIARQPRTIVDIGAAEGYYAVGFAKRVLEARVLCFDTDQTARERLCELASLNGVGSRIQSFGLCTHADLNRACAPRTLVICDIEGGEAELLDPTQAPQLAEVDMLVEMHDGPNSRAIETQLLARFRDTHESMLFSYRERTRSDFGWASPLWHSRSKLLVLDEQRSMGIRWVVLLSRSVVT